jgi:glycerol-3-phosphate O-acyltransferase
MTSSPTYNKRWTRPDKMNEARPANRRLHPSSMLRRFGWFHKLLGLGRTLKRLDLSPSSVQRILQAHQEGPLVYVLLHGSNLDYLALNHVLNERRLPLSVWANNLSHRWWEPFPDMLRALLTRWRRPKREYNGAWITQQITEGHALTVCLNSRHRDAPDPIPHILAAQRETLRPIQWLPVVVVWTRSPTKSVNPSLRFLMARAPLSSTIRQIANVVLRSRRAFVQVGESVPLPELMNRIPEARQSRALRILLRRYLKRETKIIRGPRLLSKREMRGLVLQNPAMQQVAKLEAARSHQSLRQVNKKMRREFEQMAANFRYWLIPILDIVLRPLWTKVYAGVDFPEEDLERIRSAMRKGSVVLVPCHKSHFDYVLISWVFYDNKLIIPHVVAGSNLAIPVVSWFLRSAGGFFIKRSFSEERTHPKIFARYLRELTRLGYPLEFYIEGGRTRSGKLTTPKLGVLGMLLDAASIRPFGQEITLLPVAIAYDRVAEQSVYAKESGGIAKTQESLGQFAKATGVLRNRYGRVYVRVGEPIACSTVVDSASQTTAWTDLSSQRRGQRLQQVGDSLIHRIGAVTVVLPTTIVAMALLSHHRRGLTQTLLLERTTRFRDFLRQINTPFAKSLDRFEESTAIALSQFESQGLVENTTIKAQRVWSVAVSGRVSLDYYKNHCLHLFIHMGLVAAVIRGRRLTQFSRDDLLEGFVALQHLMRHEFVFDPKPSPTEQLETGLSQLQDYGALTCCENGLQVADVGLISEIFGLFRSLLEAYWIVANCSSDPARTRKDTLKHLHDQRDHFVSSGQISRPEAITEVTLKNALKCFLADGVMVFDDRERVCIIERKRQTLLHWLTPMVNE